MYVETYNSISFYSRLAISIVLAACTTLSLVLLMQKLIGDEIAEPIIDVTPPMIDVTMPEDMKVKEVFEVIEKPIEMDPPPDAPIEFVEFNENPEVVVPIAEIIFDKSAGDFKGNIASFPVAHVLVTPKYPSRAMARNIEGWVDLRFNITSQGTTEGILVLAAEPEGVFERAAVSAVKRWKYQPFLNADGEAQPFEGLTKRVTFELQD